MEIKSINDFVANTVTSYLERSDKIINQVAVCNRCDTVLFVKSQTDLDNGVRKEWVYRKCWNDDCYNFLCARCEGNVENPFFNGNGGARYCSSKCVLDDMDREQERERHRVY